MFSINLDIDKFQIGRRVLAKNKIDGLWHDAEIKELLPEHRFHVAFINFRIAEATVSLSEIKFFTKSVRIADLTGATFAGAQKFTDFILSGFTADWRPEYI